jgi:molybdenum cofactor guanylyltransferase
MTRLVAAIVLAGGRGRRLGGVDKPGLPARDGRSLLDGVLAAVPGVIVVVVGPTRELAPGIVSVREDPPGGGPAAAVAAGYHALTDLPADGLVAVLAADLPFVTAATVERLRRAVDRHPDAGGAVLVDPDGRRQHLLGVWRRDALSAAIAHRGSWHGASLSGLLARIPVIELMALGDEAADVDTPADLHRWLEP